MNRAVLSTAVALSCLLCSCGESAGPDPGPVPSGVYEIALLADSAQSGHDRLYAVRSDGAGWRRIDSTNPSQGPMAWSPDGASIAFAAYSPELQIIVLPQSGGVPTLIFPTTFNKFSWSPTTTVLYVSKVRLVTSDPFLLRATIFSTSASGAAPVPLTGDTLDATSPSVSPDGLKIAFSGHGASETAKRLYLMTTDGSSLKRMSTREPIALGWSPASDWIWYATTDSTYRVRADGSITLVLSSQSILPSWSPDGLEIAYSLDSDIFVVSPDGGSPRNLTNPSGFSNGPIARYSPRWSPDGRTISYLVRGTPEESGMWTMKRDGSGRRRVAAVAVAHSQDWSRRRVE